MQRGKFSTSSQLQPAAVNRYTLMQGNLDYDLSLIMCFRKKSSCTGKAIFGVSCFCLFFFFNSI